MRRVLYIVSLLLDYFVVLLSMEEGLCVASVTIILMYISSAIPGYLFLSQIEIQETTFIIINHRLR